MLSSLHVPAIGPMKDYVAFLPATEYNVTYFQNVNIALFFCQLIFSSDIAFRAPLSVISSYSMSTCWTISYKEYLFNSIQRFIT